MRRSCARGSRTLSQALALHVCSLAPHTRILVAAQEARVIKQREQEYNNDVVTKYYAEQQTIDAAAKNALKDDDRRREREARERQAERDTLDAMFRVRRSLHRQCPIKLALL